jgi:DNA-binding NarL/FixJ family response regulator
MKNETQIIIADDHAIFRAGLRQTIEGDPNFKVIAEASDGETALKLVLEQQPDVLISDVSMPKMNGFQLAEKLKSKSIATRIVFLTMHDEEEIFSRAMDLDIKGYVLKDSALVDIMNCLNAVVAGQNFTSPAMTAYLFKRANRKSEKPNALAELTETERKIIKMVAEYKTSREIGDALFISHRTVENYRTNICSKLGLRGSHALIKFALEHRKEL